MEGPLVKHAQQLLAQQGFLALDHVDGVFGLETATACVAAKRVYGIANRRLSCGPTLLAALQKGKPHKFRNALLASVTKTLHYRKQNKEQKIRSKIVEYARWGVGHEPQIHYAQERPMEMNALLRLPSKKDCSEFVTDAYRYAGAPDPNGTGYNGTGFTGTLLRHMKHTPLFMVKPGDVVVYGSGSGHHTCIVLEAGADPLLASHGQERGPMTIHQSQEQRFQPFPATWLTIF